jgi:hypothetical protein
MPKIIECKKTCDSCPSQWEIKLDDGHMMYARYRFSTLTIRKSYFPTDDIWVCIESSEQIYSEQLSNNLFDGFLSGTLFNEILSQLGYEYA